MRNTLKSRAAPAALNYCPQHKKCANARFLEVRLVAALSTTFICLKDYALAISSDIWHNLFSTDAVCPMTLRVSSGRWIVRVMKVWEHRQVRLPWEPSHKKSSKKSVAQQQEAEPMVPWQQQRMDGDNSIAESLSLCLHAPSHNM